MGFNQAQKDPWSLRGLAGWSASFRCLQGAGIVQLTRRVLPVFAGLDQQVELATPFRGVELV